MALFKHILVPTDFGEPAQHAMDFAIELASMVEAKVTLLHATWLPMSTYPAYAEGLYWPIDDMEEEADRALDAVLGKVRDRYARVEGAVVHGQPWLTILDEAKRLGCDLIVMGTHGRRGLSRMLLGSVAERVVRFAAVPVLTISGKVDDAAKAAAHARPPIAPVPSAL